MSWNWIIAWLVGYLCGSVPFALLIGKAHGVDIRTKGSGNVGATNVGRTLGRKWGMLCFALDVSKGLVPVLASAAVMGVGLGRGFEPDQVWPWLGVGAAAVVGHVFPIWLRGRGGKGVATGMGVLLGYWPVLTLPALGALVVWITITKTTRYISLASVMAAALLPVFMVVQIVWRGASWQGMIPFLAVTSVLAVIVVARHLSNISRLLHGTESKIGAASSKPSQTPES